MHEMSVALNIIDVIKDQLEKNNGTAVKEFKIEVGSISGVEIDALKFALEVAVKNTFLKNSVPHIQEVKALAKCLDCKKEFSLMYFYEPCYFCSAMNIEILKGKELQVKSILID